MPVTVEGRLVYVTTGRQSQTVKICTTQNVRGQYEGYYRTCPPYRDQQGMEAAVARFASLAELEAWLVSLNACRERDEEWAEDGPLPPAMDLFDGTNYPLAAQSINNAAREELAEYLLNCYAKIQDNLAEAVDRDIVKQGARGQLRKETELSTDRIEANLRGQNWELTLERTIVETQRNRCNARNARYEWSNQFNVASGIFGRDGGRVAIDLVRRSYHANLYDLIELKAWGAQDQPYDAAWEIVRYCLAFIVLGKERKDPYYDHLHWPRLERAELFVLAPDTWRPHNADNVMKLFHDSFTIAGDREPALSCCAFWPKVLRLTGISEIDFSGMLYEPEPEPENPYGNLYRNSERIDQIHNWIDGAFGEVEHERMGGH